MQAQVTVYNSAVRAFEKGDFEMSLRLAKQAHADSTGTDRNAALTLSVDCFLKLGRKKDAEVWLSGNAKMDKGEIDFIIHDRQKRLVDGNVRQKVFSEKVQP